MYFNLKISSILFIHTLSLSISVDSCFPAKQENTITTDSIESGKEKITSSSHQQEKNQTMTNDSKENNASFDIDYIMGKFDPASHPDFVTIPLIYADQEGRMMRKDAFSAFVSMYDAAQKEGIKLKIVSATRNFVNQKSIWERKWNGSTILEGGLNATTIKDFKKRALKILEYSSMPGSSRHHWGTDLDLNELENGYFASGQGKKIYDWLVKHGHEYGYCQVYTAKGKERPNGYNEEKWHWSYTPVSSRLMELAKNALTNEMISGFDGAETASEIDIVHKYVLGISPLCGNK